MKKHYAYIILFLLVLSSCEKTTLETEEISVEENLPPFEDIVLDGVFDVYLTQKSTPSIKISGHKDHIKNIRFTVEKNVFNIKNDTKFKWLHPENNKIKIYLGIDSIKKITAKETCYIETVGPIKADEIGVIFKGKLNQAQLELDCNTFYYWNDFPCGGKLTLTGKTKYLKLWNFALMSVDASNLNSNHVLIHNGSKGICKVRAKDAIEYSINGDGDIYLYGTPKLIPGEVTSSGKLIPVE